MVTATVVEINRHLTPSAETIRRTVPHGALPPSSLSAPATSGDYMLTKEKPYGAPPPPGPSDYGG
ncbi:hypothetical protein F2Q68_00019034 [Brassica cretica]|uniref:Uncharacterized protein n=1 Tax=Brassica cretica TaxID=69181 RepID=A0A8S9FR78_BRACR|nr:hypothetical protein F2Q68_00019034 [Brassica cretica]